MKHILLAISTWVFSSVILLAQVPVSIPDIAVSEPAGTIIEVPINVGNLTGLNVIAFQFVITFNQSILVPESPYYSTSGTLSSTPNWSVFINTGIQNQLTVGAFGSSALSGNGTLIILKFKVMSNNGSSQLCFGNFLLNNGNPVTIADDGSFSNLYDAGVLYARIANVAIAEPEESIIDIPLTIGSITGLNVIAYQFVVAFGSNILIPEPPYVIKTGTLSSTPDWSVYANPNVPNQITIGAFGTSPLTGSGKLIFLRFKVVASYGDCPLSINSFLFNAGIPAVTLSNGSVSNKNYLPPPVNRMVQNIMVLGGSLNCYDAIQNITLSNFIVNPGGTATCIAGQKILMHPGLSIKADAYFNAYITTTNSYCTLAGGLPADIQHHEINIQTETYNVFLNNEGIVKLYPNPTNDYLTFESEGFEVNSGIVIEIFNLIGENILEVEMPENNQYSINVHDWKRGIYIVRVLRGSEAKVMKVVKH